MSFWPYLALSFCSGFLITRRMHYRAATQFGWLVPFGTFVILLQVLPIQVASAVGITHFLSFSGGLELFAIQLVAVLILLGLSSRSTNSAFVEESPSRLMQAPYPVAIKGSILLMAGAYALSAGYRLCMFPESWDALAYHLPKASLWLREGIPPFSLTDSWQMALPGNGELAFLAWLGTGWQGLVVVPNLVAVTVLGAAVFELAFALTESKTAAAAVTLIASSIPMVFAQTSEAYVDLFGTAFLIASANILFIWFRSTKESNKNWFPLLLAGASCGLAVGTKPVFWVYATVLGAIAFVVARRGANKWTNWGALAFGLLLPCIFWFARAAEGTGNPFYPIQVKVANHILLPGSAVDQITPAEFEGNYVRSLAEWPIYPWVEWKRDPGLVLVPYGVDDGTGAAFAAFVPLAILLALAGFAKGERKGLATVLLVSILLLSVAWWFGLRRMPRFGLPILIAACILSASFMECLLKAFPRSAGLLLLSALAITTGLELFVDINEFGGHWRYRAFSRTLFYGYPDVIDRLPPDSRIANWRGDHNNFALAGARLQNQVIPEFEVPENLTIDWIRRRNVQYVVHQTIPGEAALPPVPPELEKVFDEVIQTGDQNRRRWQVWRFDGDLPSAAGIR